jgi:hypothetical protein
MSSVESPDPEGKRKRGRPRKKRARRLADTVSQYCGHTGESRATAFRKMASGRLKYVQDAPGSPRRIPHSEYTRQGYDLPTEEP